MSKHLPYADILANRLDKALPPGQKTIPAASSDLLVNTAVLLAKVEAPELSIESMTRIQGLVLDAYAQQPVAPRLVKRNPVPRAKSSYRWWAALAASVAVIASLAGLVPASANSLPGDTLYPVKRLVEGAELSLAFSADARASVHLQHAERRVDEVEALAGRGVFDPALVNESLTSMAAAADAAEESQDAVLLATLQNRSVDVNARLDAVLISADDNDLVPMATLVPLATQVQATQDSGELLLPTATPTNTATPTATATQTSTATPTFTPSPTATMRPTNTATNTPLPTSTPLPTNTVVPTAVPTRVPVLPTAVPQPVLPTAAPIDQGNPSQPDPNQPQPGQPSPNQPVEQPNNGGDGDRGHGNDADGHDEDNPGNSGNNGRDNGGGNDDDDDDGGGGGGGKGGKK
jgi:hypothetical protein